MTPARRTGTPLLLLALVALAALAVLLLLALTRALPLPPVAVASLVLVAVAGVALVSLAAAWARHARHDATAPDIAQTVVAELPDAVAVLEPDGNVRAANRRFGELLGGSRELRSRGVAALLGDAGFPTDLAEEVVTAPRLEGVRSEPRHPGDRAFEASVLPLDRPGCEGCRLLVLRDITHFKREEALLAHLATHDALTGLANRRTLEEALGRAIARAERGTHSVLAYMDVDRFKGVNDLHGHQRGDELLVAIGQVLSAHLRGGDLASRIGGDEFALLLEDVDDDTARGIAGRLLLSVSGIPAPGSRGSHSVSLSIGLTALAPGDTPASALGRADVAMYRVKERGGDGVEAFDPSVDYSAERESAEHTLGMLRDALSRRRLFVEYQPIVRLRDGLPVSHEALVRVRLDDRVAPPAEFLPLAERHGLMPDVTDAVIGHVLEALRTRPDMRASLNLSAADLADPRFPGALASRLESGKVAARRITLEVPESFASADPAFARGVVVELQNRGFRVALDSLRSGSASIELLRALPVDRVKVDRRIVGERTDARTWLVRLDVIRQIAESRGISVVVQGVEDASTEQALKRIGVSYAQGTFFARPSETPLQDMVFSV